MRHYETLTFPMPIYAALWTNGTTCTAGSIDTYRE